MCGRRLADHALAHAIWRSQQNKMGYCLTFREKLLDAEEGVIA